MHCSDVCVCNVVIYVCGHFSDICACVCIVVICLWVCIDVLSDCSFVSLPYYTLHSYTGTHH